MMKKYIIVIGLLLPVLTGFSQVRRASTLNIKTDSAGHQQLGDAGAQRKDMLKELNLTKEQKQRMKAIREAGQAKRQAIEDDSLLSDTERRQRLRALRITQEDSVAKVLTPEQFEKFKMLRPQPPKKTE